MKKKSQYLNSNAVDKKLRKSSEENEAAAAESNETSPSKSIQNGTDLRISHSPYETKVFKVLVGPVTSQRKFFVHQGILEQSPSLGKKVHDAAALRGSNIYLIDTDPVVFELVLRFLYTGKYQGCLNHYEIFPTSEGHDSNTRPGPDRVFEIHSFLYCFAREHKIDELASPAQINIENMTLPYQNLLDIARRVYPKLPVDDDDDDDNMYRKKFRHETRVAMNDNKNLIREPWILDVFKYQHGALAVDLFTTLTEALRYDGEANDCESPPPPPPPLEPPFSPSTVAWGKKKLVQLHGDDADSGIQEPKAPAEDEEIAWPDAQETTADSPDYPDPCEPEPAPETYQEPAPEEPAPEPEPEPEQEQAEAPAAVDEPALDYSEGFKPKGRKGKKGKNG
ncbi:hypothetical protein AJ78_03012 [Emergomyces pasteurianus Ep9510]|uniref:BTB domain-containing protein n=1 Tax=Emergomyces pasteurianus Ep9510 TaxID=1447872 RepID=A0A1J9QLV2_9EURO|nr:hypothetical protein AJ78_03012 [Emergomyces pasteurianus Ep9510]